MDRLVTFGCSLTYGQYLDNSSEQSWPSVLAKKLGIVCDNQAVNGASTKQIWWNIINYDFSPQDTVIILWSHLDRWCIIKSDQVESLNVWDVEKNHKTRTYYEHIHDDYDMLVQYLLMVNHAKQYLDSQRVAKQIHLTANPIDQNFIWNQTEFVPVDMSYIRKQFPKAQDNHHPGSEAHKEFAKQVYRYYNKGKQ